MIELDEETLGKFDAWGEEGKHFFGQEKDEAEMDEEGSAEAGTDNGTKKGGNKPQNQQNAAENPLRHFKL